MRLMGRALVVLLLATLWFFTAKVVPFEGRVSIAIIGVLVAPCARVVRHDERRALPRAGQHAAIVSILPPASRAPAGHRAKWVRIGVGVFFATPILYLIAR